MKFKNFLGDLGGENKAEQQEENAEETMGVLSR